MGQGAKELRLQEVIESRRKGVKESESQRIKKSRSRELWSQRVKKSRILEPSLLHV